MSIKGMALTGLAVKPLSELLTFTKALELLLLTLAGIIAVYVLPKIPYWFDEWIDKVVVMDFNESTKKEFSNIIRWAVYLLVFYLALYLVGFKWIHQNPLFQLIVVFFGIKVAISALKPSVKKLDGKVSSVTVSENGILMKVITSLVYLLGFFVALNVIGLDGALTTALAGAGVLGLVIGLGAKDIVSNTLSGIIIAVDDTFDVGDHIEVNGSSGIVEDMGLRTTTIRTFDNKMITVPNSKIGNNPVTNYSVNDTRRVSILVGIGYDSDMEEVTETLKKELEALDNRVKEKPPQVLLDEFADSAIMIEGRVWINQRQGNVIQSRSDIKRRVFDAFREKDIDIPFPTRVIIEK